MTPDVDLGAAVEDALRAPSVHNTQPWRWRLRAGAVELHADTDRHLAATDPDRRDLVLSCGAALHHLLVALAARGAATDVARLPDPEDRHHLATVRVVPGPPDAACAALYPAIAARRTDRRRMSRRPVPAAEVDALAARARHHGAALLAVRGERARHRLAELLADAGRGQRFVPGYPGELQLWTRRTTDSRDGVPAANVAPPRADTALRAFPRGTLAQPPLEVGAGAGESAAELAVLTTAGDGVADRLRAGEALSAVLLAATGRGLATTPLSQAVEMPRVRRVLRQEILHVPEDPQLLLRIGWPATGAQQLPETPRRPLHAVLLHG